MTAVRFFWIAAVGLLTTFCSSSEGPIPTTPAVRFIADAFKRHQLVALSELHGNAESFTLFTSLVRDPAFHSAVSDIVVEFGNARYQDVADRYVGGEEVDRDQLVNIWRETTQVSGIWDLAMYEQMLKAVRDANAGLPAARRMRVWLGDPPIDWSKVVSPADDDMNDWRDAHFAHIVEERIRKPGRKGLLFIGGGHISRRVIFPNSLIHLLDRNPAPPAFVVSVVDVEAAAPAVASRLREWPVPSAAGVRNTWLGRTDVREVGHEFSRGTLEQDVDAVIVLSHSRLTHLPPPHVNPHSPYGIELARRRRLAAATQAFRSGGVGFVRDDARLTPESETPLGEVLAELRRDSGLELMVKAFADENEREVMALTTRRAATVVPWLTTRGINADRLSARGCGASRPLFRATTEDERARNRRAELVRRTPDAHCHPPW